MFEDSYKAETTRKDHQHTLKFETLDQLRNAIEILAGTGPNAMMMLTLDDLNKGPNGKERIDFVAKSMKENEAQFVQDLLNEMGDLSKPYFGAWDLLGVPAPFYKIVLQAHKSGDAYFLYVNTNERDLAEKVGAPLSYVGCTITRTWQTEGTRFAIPLKDIEAAYEALGQSFDRNTFIETFSKPKIDERYKAPRAIFKDVSEAISTLSKNKRILSKTLASPRAVFQSLTSEITKMRKDTYYRHIESLSSPVTLFADNEARATLSFIDGRIASGLTMKNFPERDFGIRIENDCLTGPNACTNGQTPPFAAGLKVDIDCLNGATYDKRLENRIRALGDAVEVIWKAPRSTPTPTAKTAPTL